MKEAEKEENSETSLLQVKHEDLLFSSMSLKIKDEDDRREIKMILFNLGYPSSELADLHFKCDRVGNHDVLKRDESGAVAKKTVLLVLIARLTQTKLYVLAADFENRKITFLYAQHLMTFQG